MENLLENLLEIFRYRSRFSLLIMPCVCYTWGVLVMHILLPPPWTTLMGNLYDTGSAG
jgi:hypothetical protein